MVIRYSTNSKASTDSARPISAAQGASQLAKSNSQASCSATAGTATKTRVRILRIKISPFFYYTVTSMINSFLQEDDVIQ